MSTIKTQTQFKCKADNKCTFVNNATAKKDRKDIFLIIRDTNKLMKEESLEYPGASAMLVGSAKRSMIYIKSENDNQYDHDIQNKYSNKKNSISEGEKTNNLRKDFMKNFNEIVKKLKKSGDLVEGVKWKLQNSTSAITVTKTLDGVLLTSFDIAFIDALNNKIHKLDKVQQLSIWNELKGNSEKAYQDAKTLNLKLLKEMYLNLKCNQKDLNKNDIIYKPSTSLFIEAVNNCKKIKSCNINEVQETKPVEKAKSKK
ncbi:MAG: hypothetical protein KFW07_04145 [Mycoplasmataceae bacterium]|nr:hypothetical protein [Mycoplasmataceae bacterium]